jgi:hypothetical protein
MRCRSHPVSQGALALTILTAASLAGAGETAVRWQVDTHG